MARIVIANGGMAGCMAAAAFIQEGHTVVLVRHNGSEFKSGGLKYLHKTAGMEALLRAHSVLCGVKDVCGKIMLEDWSIWDYPQMGSGCTDTEMTAQRLHWLKTRKTPSGFEPTI